MMQRPILPALLVAVLGATVGAISAAPSPSPVLAFEASPRGSIGDPADFTTT